MEFGQIGQIVVVRRGRDRGSFMVVVAASGESLYLADGRRRRLGKPKKKNRKHVGGTNCVVGLLPECGRHLQDADIRKAIRNFVLKEVSNIV